MDRFIEDNSLIIKCLLIVFPLLLLTYNTACPRLQRTYLWCKKQTVWLAIAWTVIIPVSVIFCYEYLDNYSSSHYTDFPFYYRPYIEWLIISTPPLIITFFIWYIVFRMKELGFGVQFGLLWVLFGLSYPEFMLYYYSFDGGSFYDGFFSGSVCFWLIAAFGMLVFFIFQSLRKLFFDQVKLNPKFDYIPISKKVRFSFLTCLYVGCFYFIGLFIGLVIMIGYQYIDCVKHGGVW